MQMVNFLLLVYILVFVVRKINFFLFFIYIISNVDKKWLKCWKICVKKLRDHIIVPISWMALSILYISLPCHLVNNMAVSWFSVLGQICFKTSPVRTKFTNIILHLNKNNMRKTIYYFYIILIYNKTCFPLKVFWSKIVLTCVLIKLFNSNIFYLCN